MRTFEDSDAGIQLHEAWNGVPVLVTGGAGFIGSHLARRLAKLGAEVRVLDDLSTGSRENVVYGSADLHVDSILDERALDRVMRRCRHVFHLAAAIGPAHESDSDRYYMVNVVGTSRVIEAARRHGVSRVILASSAVVYGSAPGLPSVESDVQDAWSPYAASKLAAELVATAAARCHGADVVGLRYFEVYGPRQNSSSPYASAVNAFAQALMDGRAPELTGDGRQTRDYTFVDDAVEATLLAALAPNVARGQMFNVGTGRETSSGELLCLVSDELGMRIAPSYAPEARDSVKRQCASLDNSRSVLGYEPKVRLEEGLTLAIRALRARAAA
jgi:UDP-glucose 4-epimerase